MKKSIRDVGKLSFSHLFILILLAYKSLDFLVWDK